MKNSLLGLVALVGLVSAFGAGGCSSGPSAAEVTASCGAYCDMYAAAACEIPIYTDAAACKADECQDTSSLSDDCRQAFKDFYECQRTQADICADDGCLGALLNVATACGAT